MKAIFGLALLLLVPVVAFAQESDDVYALEESIIPMSIPSNNKLPWGFVEGKIASPALEHPVIIQIYKGDDPVQFAQIPVNPDGTYQYKFRVLDTTHDKTMRIFDGDYTVKIFKVVNINSSYLDSYLKDKSSSLKTIVF